MSCGPLLFCVYFDQAKPYGGIRYRGYNWLWTEQFQTQDDQSGDDGGIFALVGDPGYQGGYECSIRSVTKWENASYVIEHPNYYSRYMNSKIEKDGLSYNRFLFIIETDCCRFPN